MIPVSPVKMKLTHISLFTLLFGTCHLRIDIFILDSVFAPLRETQHNCFPLYVLFTFQLQNRPVVYQIITTSPLRQCCSVTGSVEADRVSITETNTKKNTMKTWISTLVFHDTPTGNHKRYFSLFLFLSLPPNQHSRHLIYTDLW